MARMKSRAKREKPKHALIILIPLFLLPRYQKISSRFSKVMRKKFKYWKATEIRNGSMTNTE
jgi:hypothetical protein